MTRLQAGDPAAARFVGLTADEVAQAALSPALQVQLAPMLHKAAMTMAINDAWAMIAVLTVAALALLPLVPRQHVT
jgi:DHA2 family multidrug resistance protein